MCRLFAFKSIIKSQVHSSLIHAENALSSQSMKHPDGWGVAYYIQDVPHLIKSMDRAIDDQIFHKVSGVVSSQTVLAHIRKATHGDKSILNSHPFQYGKWIFAHNGNLKNLQSYRQELLNEIDPELRNFIFGNTDSEIIFFLILTFIKRKHPLISSNIPMGDIFKAVELAFQFIIKQSGPLCINEDPDPKENHLTVILTNGELMLAFNGGQLLHYSTHKKKCVERDTCPYFDPICENKAKDQNKVNHLLFSSEVLKGENIWFKMDKGEIIATDSDMQLHKTKLNLDFE